MSLLCAVEACVKILSGRRVVRCIPVPNLNFVVAEAGQFSFRQIATIQTNLGIDGSFRYDASPLSLQTYLGGPKSPSVQQCLRWCLCGISSSKETTTADAVASCCYVCTGKQYSRMPCFEVFRFVPLCSIFLKFSVSSPITLVLIRNPRVTSGWCKALFLLWLTDSTCEIGVAYPQKMTS